MNRKNKKRRCIYSVTALFFLLFPIPAGAGTLVTTDPIITDVKPLAFSVVWSANQPSTPSLEVYADDGTVPVAGCTITNESGAHFPAENNGVMKVLVSVCLNLGESYSFKTVTTSKDSGEVRSGDLTPVQMGASALVVDNDPLAVGIFKEGTLLEGQNDPANYANGTLLLVSTELAKYPVTGWVGDGIQAHPSWAYVNMDNFISASDYKFYNMKEAGGELLKIMAIGGFFVEAETSHSALAKTGRYQVPDPDYMTLALVPGIGATSGRGGSITPSGAVRVNKGANQIFTITPDAAYRVDHVLVDGASVGGVTSYIFSNVVAPHSIEAVFKGLMGDIDGNGVVDLTDVNLALQVLSGKTPTGIRDDYLSSRVDVNGDNRIGMEEVAYILQIIGDLR